MVRAVLEEEKEMYMNRLGYFKGLHENGGRQTTSLVLDQNSGSLSPSDQERMTSRSNASAPLHDSQALEQARIGSELNRTQNIKSRLAADGSVAKERHHSDMKLMKEKFAKLLLGEDMSGGGKGVSSALALSNAITNLAASVFGEQKRLEPMLPDTKARWRKEIDWLLSVTDHIVELVPSKQRSKDGTAMEIMVTKQRNDIQMNISALCKLDAMLLDCLDNFKDQNEFCYVSKGDEESQKGKNMRNDEKWWIPVPKVPTDGLSEVTRKWLQYQKDSVNQVLKAAMAINAQVLSEMEIPENYIESLPKVPKNTRKNGRASLGDLIYKGITDDHFDPDYFLSSLDMSSEHKILDLKNRIEASVVIWKRKMTAKESKSSWGSGVSTERRELFEERAETILLIIKHRFPGISQSSLDISKIQYNKDVGHAILESYSRIIESLAYTVLSRIDDIMHADNLARNPSGETRSPLKDQCLLKVPDKFPHAKEELDKLNSSEKPTSMTLLDFMGWTLDQGDSEAKKDSYDDSCGDADTKFIGKPNNNVTNKKMSYIEKLEILGGSRSPTARH